MENTIRCLDGTTLYIKENFVKSITRYIQIGNRNEAGGVLFGMYAPEEQCYTICDLSEPTSLDKRYRNGFIRSSRGHQQIINEKWNVSKGIINYIGEWHTHPTSNPTPSNIDRALIRQVIYDKSNVYPKVFLVILGNDASLYLGMADSAISSEIVFTYHLLGE